MDYHPLPNWNARKIREARTPLMGNKPLRDIQAYVSSRVLRNKVPDTAFGHAFDRACMEKDLRSK